MLEEWHETAMLMCTANDADKPAGHNLRSAAIPATSVPEGSSWLRCRVTKDQHLPPATAPHTACDGKGLVFDFSAASPAKCLRHRPGYNCDGPPYFYQYGKGFIKGACHATPALKHSNFPRDFLRDIFDSFAGIPSVASPSSIDSSAAPPPFPVALVLTRERREHANLFHTSTDFMNAFFALHMAGIIDGTKVGDRRGMESVGVIILDEQPEGPFDSVWPKVFGPAYGLHRPSQFLTKAPTVAFDRVVFSPPGYTHFLFAHLFSEGDCREPTHLLRSFREFMLSGLGIATPASSRRGLRVLFISRRPYSKFVDHKFVGRQVDNEDAVMEAMRSDSHVEEARRVDMVEFTFTEQLAMIAGTDILVGMHGAALSHAVFLPPWAGVVELWPKNHDMWRCFEHLTEMAGPTYARWANRDPRRFRRDKEGDYTNVDISSFMEEFHRVKMQVLHKRKTLLAHKT